jgi:hypothetical protein
MDDPTTRRRRRRQSDQYADDVLRDGEFLRVPMTLADSAMRDVIHQTYPPRGGYRRGYVYDQISNPVEEGGWPTQAQNLVPMFGHAAGEPCRCVNGRPGTLRPHPTIQSSLLCVENGKDGLDAASIAYYQMCDEAANAWREGKGVSIHDCGCHSAGDQRIAGVPPPASRKYPRNGYSPDPNASGTGEGRWPNPDDLGPSQVEGAECTVNGSPGRIVKENGKYVCKPRQDLDCQTIRDMAYAQSIRDAENAWRPENWPRGF